MKTKATEQIQSFLEKNLDSHMVGDYNWECVRNRNKFRFLDPNLSPYISGRISWQFNEIFEEVFSKIGFNIVSRKGVSILVEKRKNH